MDKAQVSRLRKTNTIPFKVIYWLEALVPVLEHDDLGVMYKGCVIVEDSFGRYAAIIGTTDKLLSGHYDVNGGTPFKVLKVESNILAFGRACWPPLKTKKIY